MTEADATGMAQMAQDAETISNQADHRYYAEMEKSDVLATIKQDMANYVEYHSSAPKEVTRSDVDLLRGLMTRIGSAITAIEDGRK